MNPVTQFRLLVTLAAALACSGCLEDVELPVASAGGWAGIKQETFHRCRSSVSQTTQKGCLPSTAVARR